MEREGVEVEEGAEGEEAADAVDGGEEDEGTAWVAEEEVVEVDILSTEMILARSRHFEKRLWGGLTLSALRHST